MRKLMCIILIVMTMLTGSICALAETEGDYEFKISNNEAIITKAAETLTGEVIIPSELGGCSVVKIDAFAFAYNTNIEKIVVPDTVKVIDAYAFFHCESLTEATIGENVETIGGYAFSSTALYEIIIPDSVEYIGVWAFSSDNMTDVIVGKGVTNIEEGAFNYCGALKRIAVHEENKNYTSFGGVLFNKDKTTLVSYPGGKEGAYVVPSGVKTIGESAFEGAEGITSLILSESVEKIVFGAFMSTANLESITINSGIKSVESYAFASEGLKNIYFTGTEDEWNSLNLKQSMLENTVTISCNASVDERAKIVFNSGEAVAWVNTDGLSGYVICALYENDCLVGVTNKAIDGALAEFEINENNFDTIKVFVFDSMESLVPVCEAISL